MLTPNTMAKKIVCEAIDYEDDWKLNEGQKVEADKKNQGKRSKNN